MNTCLRLLLATAGLVGAFATPLRAETDAPAYELVDLGTLGGAESYAYGLSAAALVVGSASTDAGDRQAFLFQDGVLIDLGAPDGFARANVVAVNDSAHVVGTVTDIHQEQYAYLWDDGVWTPLGSHGGLPYATVSDIDAAGRVIGYSFELGGEKRAFLWDNGDFIDLPTLGLDSEAHGFSAGGLIAGSSRDSFDRGYAVYWDDAGIHNLGYVDDAVGSKAYDVNDAGDACGTCTFFTPPYFNHYHAAAWICGEATLLEIPYVGSAPGTARAINNAGQIVGYVKYSGQDPGPAVLWSSGEAYDLDELIDPDLGWHLMVAFDINEAGAIVGYGETPGGDIHAYLLVPVTCAEDLTGDGFVGQDDLGVLLAAYGVDDGGDIDGDGDTDQADLGALLGAFGGDCP